MFNVCGLNDASLGGVYCLHFMIQCCDWDDEDECAFFLNVYITDRTAVLLSLGALIGITCLPTHTCGQTFS